MLPFSWELVEICRWLPSAPVAVIVTEEALVVCQFNVTAWPEVMLALLAEKARVGDDVIGELDEPELQPVRTIRDEIAANPNRILEHFASGPILLSLDDEICRPCLLLRILHPPLYLLPVTYPRSREGPVKLTSQQQLQGTFPYHSLFLIKLQAGKPCGQF